MTEGAVVLPRALRCKEENTMANAINTYTELILLDGTRVKMTLNYARLLKLSQDESFKDVYMRYSSTRMDGIQGELDVALQLYTGYLCANVDDLANVMTEDQFYEAMDPNRAVTDLAWRNLLYPKRAAASKKRS